ncbi:MAG: WYL domain-containing protein [Flammeovirgaceae bacterium]
MPISKNKYARFQIINECLRSKKLYNWKALAEACFERLDESVGRRTIFKDIEEMNQEFAEFAGEGFDNLIEYDRGKKCYYYTNKEFNLNKTGLNSTDYALLREALEIFRQFKELPQLEGFENIVMKLQELFFIPNTESYLPIQFEKLPPQRGLKWLSVLYDCVLKKNVIKINYTPFLEKEIEEIVHPYLLKEYNHRWFLIAWNEAVQKIYVYALDRIVNITTCEATFFMDDSFNSMRYYKDIIGVTLYTEQSAEEIELLFEKKRGQYVITKPIHESQSLIEENEKSVKIGLRLIPNPELEAWILSFGNDVKVIKPLTLADKVKERLKKGFENYLTS